MELTKARAPKSSEFLYVLFGQGLSASFPSVFQGVCARFPSQEDLRSQRPATLEVPIWDFGEILCVE